MEEMTLYGGGKVYVSGKKIYAICPDCYKFIRINKPFFGSIHICATEEEIEQRKY